MANKEFTPQKKSSSSDNDKDDGDLQQNSQVECGTEPSNIESEGDLYSQDYEENLENKRQSLNSKSQNLDSKSQNLTSEEYGEDLGKFKSIESEISLVLDVEPINWNGDKVATGAEDEEKGGDAKNENDPAIEDKSIRIERNSSAHEMYSELLDTISLSSVASGDTMRMFDTYLSNIKQTISSSSEESVNDDDEGEDIVHKFCVKWFCCSLLIPTMEVGPSRGRKTRSIRSGKGKSGGHKSSRNRSEQKRKEIEKKKHRLNQKLAKMSPREAHEYKEQMLKKYSAKKEKQKEQSLSSRKSRDKSINGGDSSGSCSKSRSSSKHKRSSRRKKMRSKNSRDSEGKKNRKSSSSSRRRRTPRRS
mmetsp:Transcript_15684/g.23490  ORF Transcript_15684/g.23490 Transcript_15684/m.23490 type:complete len:361 (-) Transcript_15684:65-1147(-)|eukprot:CAMPEP_0194086648 /NCGR_PEP_ID=MMETSP0149-20130528/21904_1 /TAXON_ID=122233 /ORGANISM="Chaetoceros debilis, Strain MM31A-1" /LENGTH=360 /DNA_ID=CAMNT_0038769781 /DNA_START=114 /DNA_END=1196 /DNA_ORIENTATION=+